MQAALEALERAIDHAQDPGAVYCYGLIAFSIAWLVFEIVR